MNEEQRKQLIRLAEVIEEVNAPRYIIDFATLFASKIGENDKKSASEIIAECDNLLADYYKKIDFKE